MNYIIILYCCLQTCGSYEKIDQNDDKTKQKSKSTHVFNYIFEICTICDTNHRL